MRFEIEQICASRLGFHNIEQCRNLNEGGHSDSGDRSCSDEECRAIDRGAGRWGRRWRGEADN